jgi:GT2 family glycosyltransferase
MSKETFKNINGVSFIIPTWNKRDMVVTCIKLLDKYLSVECPEIPKEIIIVDNGSIDGTSAELKKLKIPNTKYLIQDTNLGFAKAINMATDHAKYNYIYLLNNDMEVQPHFFETIIHTAQNLLDQSINFFGVSSQIFFFDPKVPRVESGKTYTQFKKGKLLVGHELNSEKLKNVSLAAYCGGGSSLINKQIFELLGKLDSNVYLPLYCEDLDIGFVAWKKGYPSFFCPNSHVIHHHRSSSKLLSFSPDYFIHKNYLAFCLKNFDSFKLKLELFLMYPLYLIFKKDYGKYLIENLKNIFNIINSRHKTAKIPNVYSDSELINFIDFEKQYGLKYKT